MIKVTSMGMRLLACLIGSYFFLVPNDAFGVEPILWRAGNFINPARSTAEISQALQEFVDQGTDRHLVVQFDGPVGDALRGQLEDAGLQLLNYLGGNAFFASVSVPDADPEAISRFPTLIGAQRIEQAWKIHPYLDRVPGFPLPIVTENNGDPIAALYVVFHRDVLLIPDGAAAVQRRGGAVVSQLTSVNALVITIPIRKLAGLANEDVVQWIEPALPPVQAINSNTRLVTQADVVQAAPYGLDGTGVSVLVFDAGDALMSHADFSGRLHARDGDSVIDHATHVSCTVGGDGTASGGLFRGMAPNVAIESYGFSCCPTGFLYTDPSDLEMDYDEAINVYGADISNNSIGTNTCANGFPCSWTGDYGVTDQLIDSIVKGSLGAPFRIVWANGNERGCTRCRDEGVHTPEGYHSTAPPACAKNHITVGALNDDESVASFTSWGPADDGRLKPDVSAPGVSVTSCSASGGYASFSGTSMASPAVAGISSLILQDYRVQFPLRSDPRNSTLKALLAHTALDIQNPGPDYKTGYGSVKVRNAIDYLRSNSGQNFLEAEVVQQQVFALAVRVNPGDTQLKVTLAWDDFPGTPNVNPALVNDLDLRVFDPASHQAFPWTLNPANPGAIAGRTQADHVNNIEQVLVDSPVAGLWLVEVFAFNVPEGPVTFSLCASPRLVVDCDNNGVSDDQQILADPSLDCGANGVLDVCEPDCDGDGTANLCEIFLGNPDCDENGIPDDCDIAGGAADCEPNGIPDECEPDCNQNGVSDACDISSGTSADCEPDGVPDECEPDCNRNGVPDGCDILAGTSEDCQLNSVPDECEIAGVSFAESFAATALDPGRWCTNNGGVVDSLAANEPSPPFSLHLNGTDTLESCVVDTSSAASADVIYWFEQTGGNEPPDPGNDLFAEFYSSSGMWTVLAQHLGSDPDMSAFQQHTVPLPLNALHPGFRLRFRTTGDPTFDDWFVDDVEIFAAGSDCNHNGVPDVCDIDDGTSEDCSGNGTPDECEPDCNNNSIADSCDIIDGTSPDCNGNGIPDECEIDCNNNTVPDDCDMSGGTSQDCNANEVPDECDIAGGASEDCQPNGVPDECEVAGNSLIVNGGFETGDFTGWSIFSVGSGGIAINDGTFDPDGPDGPLPPCDGSFAAVTFQGGPARHTLFQEVTIPAAAGSATLHWTDRIRNHAAEFSDPNQEFRVEVWNTSNFPLAELFSTGPGFPLLNNCVTRSASVSAFIGQTVRIAFTMEDDLFYFNLHLDAVRLDAGTGATGEDCNGNAVPDECDIADGTSFDCQPDGTPDECQTDCNNNLIADTCDIASGTSIDCQPDGIPDECQTDCNTNGVADACDIASGTSQDCQADGVPDECQLLGTFFDDSGPLSPIDGANPKTHTVPSPPPANGDVTLNFTASADLDLSTEFIDVNINGAPIGRIFRTGAAQCPGIPNTATLVITAGTFNSAVGGGSAAIGMVASPEVTPGICPASFISVTLTYGAGGDCNHNGVADACDVSGGSSSDCQPNGIPDECEPDCNHNGVADACDVSSGTSLDCQPNGIPDECESDCNGNSIPDECDISGGFSSDCQPNGIPDECDLASGAPDCDGNGVPDQCELLTAVLSDTFPSTVLNPATWCVINGVVVDTVGTNEPSPPNSLRFNGPDFIESCVVNLAAGSGGRFRYWFEQTGGGESPDPGNNLIAEYYSSANTWVGVATHLGSDPDMTNYQEVLFDLPLNAFHAGFKIRFRSTGDSGFDDWFVDDVEVRLAGEDCNHNGIHDACETAQGLTPDCQPNGIPDDCETDCNGNTVPDDCDVSSGTSNDCQSDGIPDECQLATPFVNGSGTLAPMDAAHPQTHNIVNAPTALGLVTLTFTASADLASTNEYIDVDINGTPVGRVFEAGGSDCPVVPNSEQLLVPASVYNGAVGGGDAAIHLVAGPEVSPGVCNLAYITVSTTYQAFGDCNNNTVPDECDISDGTSSDCQPNGIPDECEPDCNNNGVADACDIAGGGSADCEPDGIPDECESDCNNNGTADTCDISGGASSDCQPNGIPDECDLASGLGQDCQPNGIPDDCELAQGSTVLEAVLFSLNQGHNLVTEQIPSRFDFIEGDVGTCITDGGGDMYDCGNTLNTNVAVSIPYTMGEIVATGAAFGPGSSYATAKHTGLFVLAVADMSIDTFTITGDTGTDGAGLVSGAVLPITVDNRDYTLFVKRIFASPDPSINHILIVPGNGAGVTHSYPIGTSSDLHTLNGLFGIDRLYYLLVSRHDGNFGLELPDADVLNVAREFLELVDVSAVSDCNGNDTLDVCDVADGTSEDCQPDQIPDECQADCNANDVPDNCDIAGSTSNDCQLNGVPDECDIAAGTSQDCQPDDVPDECQPDCNQNSVADSCDISTGTSLDCQTDGIPDECQIVSNIVVSSGPLSPIDAANSRTYAVPAPLPALGSVVLDFSASADLSSSSEYIDAFLNSTFLGRVFGATGGQCAVPPDAASLSISSTTFNALIGGGNALFLLRASTDVTPGECPNSFIQLTVRYVAREDCNLNGVPDDCDVLDGFSADCQPNGTPDECDADPDSDGHPNGCDLCPNAADPGQTDTDGDEIGDACDDDDDNDCVADGSDPQRVNPSICGDADADGCDDCSVGSDGFGPHCDNLPAADGPDADGDGRCNLGDADDDNDCVPDMVDSHPFDPRQCTDVDSDGCDDCSVGSDGFGPLCDNLPAVDGPDLDGDGRCNSGDADDDGDCVPDAMDVDPADPLSCSDADGDGCDDCSIGADGFGPLCDNRPAADGPDLDGDGLCNSGDPDDDNDCVPDAGDADPADPLSCADADGDGCDDCSVGSDGFGPLCDNLPAADGPDLDGDGRCDLSDPDLDNDCVPNSADPAVLDPARCGDVDLDRCDDCSAGIDGLGPLCDQDPDNDGPDADGDGVCDASDLCPTADDRIDNDQNGVPDCTEPIPTVSQWGVIVLALMLLSAQKISFGRRRSREA